MANVPSGTTPNTVAGAALDGAAIERAISRLDGVCGARVMVEEREIKEVHVLASPRRAPKKIIRDIESMVLVQFNYRIDYRRISLAQVADQNTSPAAPLVLAHVEQQQTPQGAELVVVLSDEQHTYRGTQLVNDDAAHAAASATVAAFNQAFAATTPLVLRDLETTTLGGRDVVIAYVLGQNGAHLLGTAFVQSSLPAAAARAVLQATNAHHTNGLSDSATTVLARMLGA